jgi:hypothetical protein
MVLTEICIVGFMSKETLERIENCIKSNTKLIFNSNDIIDYEGLDIVAEIIE